MQKKIQEIRKFCKVLKEEVAFTQQMTLVEDLGGPIEWVPGRIKCSNMNKCYFENRDCCWARGVGDTLRDPTI